LTSIYRTYTRIHICSHCETLAPAPRHSYFPLWLEEASPASFVERLRGKREDHIPPDSLFAQPKPSNLITVPCCETCRTKDATNDEFMLDLFISLAATENHPTIRNQIAPERFEVYRKFPDRARRLLALTVDTPHGKAFRMGTPEVDRFLERISRAVLYDALQIPPFSRGIRLAAHTRITGSFPT